MQPCLISRFLILLSLLFSTVEFSCGLKCICNTNKGPGGCVQGICEVGIDDYHKQTDDSDTVAPFCAAISHPVYGEFYSCTFAASQERTRKCTTVFTHGDTVATEKCWCNSGDFCNDDLLFPREKEDEQVNSTTASSTSSPQTTTVPSTPGPSHTESDFKDQFTQGPEAASEITSISTYSQSHDSTSETKINSFETSTGESTVEYKLAISDKIEKIPTLDSHNEEIPASSEKSIPHSIDTERVKPPIEPVIFSTTAKIDWNLIRPMRTGYSNSGWEDEDKAASVQCEGAKCDGKNEGDSKPDNSVDTVIGKGALPIWLIALCSILTALFPWLV